MSKEANEMHLQCLLQSTLSSKYVYHLIHDKQKHSSSPKQKIYNTSVTFSDHTAKYLLNYGT